MFGIWQCQHCHEAKHDCIGVTQPKRNDVCMWRSHVSMKPCACIVSCIVMHHSCEGFVAAAKEQCRLTESLCTSLYGFLGSWKNCLIVVLHISSFSELYLDLPTIDRGRSLKFVHLTHYIKNIVGVPSCLGSPWTVCCFHGYCWRVPGTGKRWDVSALGFIVASLQIPQLPIMSMHAHK